MSIATCTGNLAVTQKMNTALDEQSLSYVIFFLALAGIVFYTFTSFFYIVSLLTSRVILHRKTDVKPLHEDMPGVSVVKPLMGTDPFLLINLESHFTMTYHKFELLFCVQDDQDPAINVVNKLRERYPKVDARIFIGGKDGVINPMVNNIAPGYENAKYDFVWISTCRIKASTDILVDMVDKLLKPDVALVHQMPFTTNQNTFGAMLEKIYFGCAMARFYISFNFLGMSCTTGMSYLFKKSILDELGGFAFYGQYLAEDYFISKAFHDKGYRLVLSTYPAQQNVANTTVCGYKNRMVRWLRLRLNMIPIVSGVLEPMGECIALGLWSSWCFYHFFSINPYCFFAIHTGSWLILDYIQLTIVQHGPLPFNKLQYILAWVVRELLVIVIFINALINPRRVKWGRNTYKLSLGGHTEVMKNKPMESL